MEISLKQSMQTHLENKGLSIRLKKLESLQATQVLKTCFKYIFFIFAVEGSEIWVISDQTSAFHEHE